MLSPRRHIWPSLLLMLAACDRGPEPAEVVSKAPAPAPAPAEPPAAPEPEPAPPDPEPEPPAVYDQLIVKLSEDAAPTAESESEAWTHYEAKRYAEAQRAFALASLHDREAWKHPFNLACASARLRDEAMVRVGLIEAMARDPEATAAKARGDGDLAAYRAAPWFEAVVGPRAARVPDEDEPQIPDDAALAGPKLDRPHPLPPGRHVPLAAARLEQVRPELLDTHGLYPQLRASLEFQDEAGVTRGYVVYDYSVVDECMTRHRQRFCVQRFGEGPDYDRYDRSHCTKQFIARIRFDEQLELEVRELGFYCGPADVQRLDVLDADGDGVDEVVIDIRSRAELLGMRYTSDFWSGQVFEVHRLDGSPQFRFEHHVRTYEILSLNETFRRVVTRDLDEDGHVDFVIQSRMFETNSAYRFSDDFWPDPSDERHVALDKLRTEIHEYDPEEDRW